MCDVVVALCRIVHERGAPGGLLDAAHATAQTHFIACTFCWCIYFKQFVLLPALLGLNLVTQQLISPCCAALTLGAVEICSAGLNFVSDSSQMTLLTVGVIRCVPLQGFSRTCSSRQQNACCESARVEVLLR